MTAIGQREHFLGSGLATALVAAGMLSAQRRRHLARLASGVPDDDAL